MHIKTRALLYSAAAVVGVLVAAVAQAAPVSSNYDGDYVGESRLIPGLSKPECPVSAGFEARIRGGGVFGKSDDGGKIQGFVTFDGADGFVTGSYRFHDGSKTAFEGLIDGGTFIGGLVRDDGCAWVVTLRKR